MPSSMRRWNIALSVLVAVFAFAPAASAEWFAEYCAAHPDRLIGIGQRAMPPAEVGGVMLPGNPAGADYDDPRWAPYYEAPSYWACR
jgi:hypothetical protein